MSSLLFITSVADSLSRDTVLSQQAPSILARISGSFLLNSNRNVLYMDGGWPSPAAPWRSMSLAPPCFRVIILEKWCLCFSRWHSFLWPSCPWISDRVGACTSGITFLFFLNHDYGPDKRVISLKQKWGQKRQITDKEKIVSNWISNNGLIQNI